MKYWIVLPLTSVLLFACGSLKAQSPAALPKPAMDLAERSRPDPRVRQYVWPSRIVWCSSNETVKSAEVLLRKRSGQATLDASDPCVLNNARGPAGVLLDFGRELHGGVQIMVWNTKGNKPVKLRVRFGESASEAMSDVGTKNAVNDHAVRDQ
jgi:hypothetical protein